MRISRILCILLIALVFFVDMNEARKTSGYKSSGYRPTGNTVTRRTVTKRYVGPSGRVYSGVAVVGWHPPVGIILVPGVTYYDPINRYFYNGSVTYREQQPANPVVVIIVIVVIVLICCVCAYIGKNQNYDDEGYEEVEVTETTVYHNDGPRAQTYAPGTQPPGTALTNDGHLFQFMTHNPYPDDTATCDNCQQIIQWGYGGYHCPVPEDEVDLCKNCGDGRVRPQEQMPPQGYGQPAYGQPPAYPPAYPPMQQPGYGQPQY